MATGTARPYADERVVSAARALKVPPRVSSLVELAGADDLSRIGAALIRASTDRAAHGEP